MARNWPGPRGRDSSGDYQVGVVAILLFALVAILIGLMLSELGIRAERERESAPVSEPAEAWT